MARVLVTGGGGYIGSHACKVLAAAGYEPVTFDNFGTGWRDAVRFGPVIEGDLRDRDAIEAALREVRPEAVLHFAARIEVGASVKDPAGYWANNFSSAQSLFDAMVATGTGKLVFSSTCAVNGDLDGVEIDETSPINPESPYGATKAAVELMLQGYVRAYGLQALTFRYFNVAGADPEAELGEQHQPETHLIPLVIQAIRRDRAALKVFGTDYPTRDGTCVRDYVHVRDLVAAHVAAIPYLDRPAAARVPLICLGTGRGMTVKEIIKAAEAITGAPVPHEMTDRRPGDPASLICGSALARQELNWEPVHSTPEQMIGDAWRWHQRPGYTC
ncbi:UDP-glucose 4-epimerase GalE [Pseudoruegeria sp. SK021]|uniref:UDP-glucose 4-epimerase GalE n=1 Tax=Pseudoruegeria sp. SK021 TaxID=1933035 RepID=UPI000A2273C9|nr:UDP-glucose 4-epimerase GalE [Pseudoruegeria sp. SK021]OSP54091.1 UDP-glucose 4-epimerase GalE [Pseudoruegeria sp. SK021]